MESYVFQPDQEAILSLYNGTFEKSENIISRDRILDASVIAHGERMAIKAEQWTDKDSTVTQFIFNTGKAGTYVAGVSTKARNIELAAEEFNDYLKHDGIMDMLEYRTNNNVLDQDAVESYQKHVKAIYQVGDTKTDDWKTVLGYPIEFVPNENPYEKHHGETLAVKLLLDGKPLTNQIVYANHINDTHSHDHDGTSHSHDGESAAEQDHTHTSGQQLRTDDQGIVLMDLPEDGIYYLRTIHMVNVSDSDELTHISKWATLTFELSHDGDHDHGGIPGWGYAVGVLLILGMLYFVVGRRV